MQNLDKKRYNRTEEVGNTENLKLCGSEKASVH